MTSSVHPCVLAAFQAADHTGDGFISRQALTRALQLGLPDEQIQQVLKVVDEDVNGQISYKTFLAFVYGEQELDRQDDKDDFGEDDEVVNSKPKSCAKEEESEWRVTSQRAWEFKGESVFLTTYFKKDENLVQFEVLKVGSGEKLTATGSQEGFDSLCREQTGSAAEKIDAAIRQILEPLTEDDTKRSQDTGVRTASDRQNEDPNASQALVSRTGTADTGVDMSPITSNDSLFMGARRQTTYVPQVRVDMVKKLFSDLDADASGWVSRDELRSAFETNLFAGHIPDHLKTAVDETFAKADVDGNGQLSLVEVLKVVQEIQGTTEQDAKAYAATPNTQPVTRETGPRSVRKWI